MSFLPKDYKAPVAKGNYTKLQDGENNIRIASSAIVGYEYWNDDNKPVRSREPFAETPGIRAGKDGTPGKIKHFWAFVVWNYEAKAVQIMEVTQSTIQSQIKAIVDNKKWGDPKGYDITITRTGEGLETNYVVMPNPHAALEAEVAEALDSTPVDLAKLYTGEDPFAI